MKTPYCMIDGIKFQLEIVNGVLRFPNDGRDGDNLSKMPDLNVWWMDYFESKRPVNDLFEYYTNSGSSYDHVYSIFGKGGGNNHMVKQGPEPTKRFRLFLGKLNR